MNTARPRKLFFINELTAPTMSECFHVVSCTN